MLWGVTCHGSGRSLRPFWPPLTAYPRRSGVRASACFHSPDPWPVSPLVIAGAHLASTTSVSRQEKAMDSLFRRHQRPLIVQVPAASISMAARWVRS